MASVDPSSSKLKENNGAHPLVSPPTVFDSTIYITTSAVNRLRVLKEQEKQKNPEAGLMLRIAVSSGGCYGFQYKFDFISTPDPEELIFLYEDITVVTDAVSYELLQNIILDYAQELIGSAFTLRNPNSEASCGCGNSFSI